MANHLTRFDPFSDIARLEPFHNLEEWMRDFSLRPALRDWNVEPRIKMDVEEGDTAYTVKADIPGVKKEDIQVDVDGNEVTISAELKRESEKKDGKSLRSERYYGQQTRSFTLASDIDDAKVEAKYADGVLVLTLPKKPGKSSKHVAIN
ncbi:MAG TPA: Hsp20/alpha crystallin family protein [Pseudoduganella sp.]